jgi:hypothetical protein
VSAVEAFLAAYVVKKLPVPFADLADGVAAAEEEHSEDLAVCVVGEVLADVLVGKVAAVAMGARVVAAEAVAETGAAEVVTVDAGAANLAAGWILHTRHNPKQE